MSGKSINDYQKDYTKPQLREELKEKIKHSNKAGKPDQWSARKAQLLNKEYEKHGGGYKHSGQKTPSQKNLEQWSEEDWQTMDNKVAIRKGQTMRYLPKAVWEQLSPEQKRATNKLKAKGSQHGLPRVNNPEEVREILSKVHKGKRSR